MTPSNHDNNTVVLTLNLLSADGRPFTDNVQLVLTQDGSKWNVSRSESSPHEYQVELQPGVYALKATAGDLVAPPQEIVVGNDDLFVSVYLGGKGWPYYRMGNSVIPFLPREDLVAVAYPSRKLKNEMKLKSSSDDSTEDFESVIGDLPLTPYRISKSDLESGSISTEDYAKAETNEQDGNVLASGDILVFQFGDDANDAERKEIAGALNQRVGDDARVSK